MLVQGSLKNFMFSSIICDWLKLYFVDTLPLHMAGAKMVDPGGLEDIKMK